jgi:hypothetical protein
MDLAGMLILAKAKPEAIIMPPAKAVGNPKKIIDLLNRY